MLRLVNARKSLGEYFTDWWNEGNGRSGGMTTLWNSRYNMPACYTQHEMNEIFTGVRTRWYSDNDVRSEVAHLFEAQFNGWDQIVDVCSLRVSVADWRDISSTRDKHSELTDEQIWLRCPKLMAVLDTDYTDDSYEVLELADGTMIYRRSMVMSSYQVFGNLTETQKVLLQVAVEPDGGVHVTLEAGELDYAVWDISFQGVEYVREAIFGKTSKEVGN